MFRLPMPIMRGLSALVVAGAASESRMPALVMRRDARVCCRALTTASSSLSSSPSTTNVFDRAVRRAIRDRAAAQPDSAQYDYLRDEVAARLVDRLQVIRRGFPMAVDLGCNTGNIARALPPDSSIRSLAQLDLSGGMLRRARESHRATPAPTTLTHAFIECDEEFLPLRPQSVDLILSSMSLHWVNDIPLVLKQVREALKPDGVFLCAMLGGATLQELRSSFALAETERLSGVRPHLSPFASGNDISDLVQRAGFSMPTVDTEAITVRYPDMFTLMEHLRGMGDTNCAFTRANHVSSDIFTAAAAAYEAMYADEEGLLPATFQIYYIIGWAPHDSQQKPLARGSANRRLGDLNTLLEQGAGGTNPSSTPSS